MEKIEPSISQQDLKILFVKVQHAYKGYTFEKFVTEAKQSYADYHRRNTENINKYGKPKTFSQWVNAQIIAIN